jgi:hypothetical protein
MSRSWVLQSNLAGLPDPLQPWNYDINIPNIPGGGSGYGLMLRCQSAAIPGISINDGAMQLRGSVITYAGFPEWGHMFNPSFIETRDMAVTNTLTQWITFARDNRTSATAGAYMSQYKTIGDIILYDDTGTVVRTIRLNGLWCRALPDAPLESASSGPVVRAAEFRFDWPTYM